MIKITLPKDLTLTSSPFFEQILQASTRGDLLQWNGDYSKATLELSTGAFFTDTDAKAIIEQGGEVEGYAYWTLIKKSDFETKKISKDLQNYLNSSFIIDPVTLSEDELSLAAENKSPAIADIEPPTLKETFPFTRSVKDNPEYIEFLNSANSELLPMSKSLSL